VNLTCSREVSLPLKVLTQPPGMQLCGRVAPSAWLFLFKEDLSEVQVNMLSGSLQTRDLDLLKKTPTTIEPSYLSRSMLHPECTFQSRGPSVSNLTRIRVRAY